MKKVCFIILLVSFYFFNSYGYRIATNVILALMKEFNIINPTILHNNISLNNLQKVKLIKELSYYGYSSSNYNIVGDKHSIIEFTTHFPNSKWNILSDENSPRLVIVAQIINESDLDQINLTIDKEVYFIDGFSWKIYETYFINGIHNTKCLGQIQIEKSSLPSSSNLEKISFVKSDHYISLFEKRRNNFHGIQLSAMVETYVNDVKFPNDFTSKVKYFSNNQTYEVTEVAYGIYIDILHSLEHTFNFSTKLYLRKDRKWGMPQRLSNGTEILDGMLKTITEEESIDFIWSTFAMIPERVSYLDFLPSLTQHYGGIFIPKQDLANQQQHKLYLEPFSLQLWLTILLTDIFIVVLIVIIQCQIKNSNMVSIY